MKTRSVIEQINARATSDGDGVRLLRVFGGARPKRFDPFLLLDEFGSEEAVDYIGGFPPHPHRGFETITYMLQGKMEHRDHMDNIGLLNDGDVQWMTAGRGVIHSEMPKQTEGKMRGFQLWLNLPAKKKMQAARYEDVPANKINAYALSHATVKAIAGKTFIEGSEIKGYFDVPDTEANYFDFALEANRTLTVPVNEKHNVLLYSYEGELAIGESKTRSPIQTLSRLSEGDAVVIENTGTTVARFILLTGKPLHEPVVQHGPFVMNTSEEIDKAIEDYKRGTLVA